jgi:hypothetical protein
VVQHVQPIGDRDARGFEPADCGTDRSIAQIVPRVGVEANGEHTRMMSPGRQDQVVQVLEVLGIPR